MTLFVKKINLLFSSYYLKEMMLLQLLLIFHSEMEYPILIEKFRDFKPQSNLFGEDHYNSPPNLLELISCHHKFAVSCNVKLLSFGIVKLAKDCKAFYS